MLFESICWRDGQFYNLHLHTARVQRARHDIFGLDDQWNVAEMIEKHNVEGVRLRQMFAHIPLLKLRFDYHATGYSFTWAAYQAKHIKALHVRQAPDGYEYSHKFADRTVLDALKATVPTGHEVLICTGNKVRDTSYCNVVFAEGGKIKNSLRQIRHYWLAHNVHLC